MGVLLMEFQPPLKRAILLRRYKRFLADIRLPTGEEITIHCPNTGSMRNCLAEGEACWYSTSDNPKRKYPHSWELATTPEGDIACIHSARANAVVVEAIENGVLEPLQGYTELHTEVRYGEERSRIDILLTQAGGVDCYLEVKCVTLREDGAGCMNRGIFPDSPSERSRKHLRELMLVKKQGQRAVLLFCVLHTGIKSVGPADNIDPEYGALLRQAQLQGVEILAYAAAVSPRGLRLMSPLPLVFE